ncbi:MAG: hypothetical protein NZ741_00515 [Armatimonadetes bacterium]|nr:hypothetical protein [Armatimonadota bacterium]
MTTREGAAPAEPLWRTTVRTMSILASSASFSLRGAQGEHVTLSVNEESLHTFGPRFFAPLRMTDGNDRDDATLRCAQGDDEVFWHVRRWRSISG